MRVPVQNPTLVGLNFPLATLVGIAERRKILTCTKKIDTKAKFDRLRSARLIRRDSKATKLDMQGFKWNKDS
jgi:hypothetical protein